LRRQAPIEIALNPADPLKLSEKQLPWLTTIGLIPATAKA
jgi:hypothetical protein